MTTTQTTPASSTAEAAQSNRLLPLIGAFKLAKAAVLFATAYAFHHLRHSDVEQTLTTWARVIHFDPDSTYMQRLLARVTGVSPAQLHRAGIGLFVYGSLFLTEGTGLLLRKRWAEYVTVITTSLLLPLEVNELRHPGHLAAKVAILVANLAILAYLIWNLLRSRRSEAAAPAHA